MATDLSKLLKLKINWKTCGVWRYRQALLDNLDRQNVGYFIAITVRTRLYRGKAYRQIVVEWMGGGEGKKATSNVGECISMCRVTKYILKEERKKCLNGEGINWKKALLK